MSIFFGLGFLACATFGTYVFSQKVWATARVLGENIELPRKTRVLKVTKEDDAPVILPKASVWAENGENYVLTVAGSQVSKTPVQATVWRDNYAKVTAGLMDQDLVILDQQVALGQEIRYQIVNPEAGKSGLVRN